MRALALLALLLVQDPDIDALLKQLEDESIEVREKAAAKLIELGDKAEEKVKARLASADDALKHVCKRILEQIAVPKKLRGLLPPLRKVTIEAKDRNLKEVLDDVQQQGGLALNLEGISDGTVSVSLKEATPLEALDAVCKAAGIGYFIEGGRQYAKGRAMVGGGAGPPMMDMGGEAKIRLQPGSYLSVPRQFVRHYVIEPTQINLSKTDNFRQSTSSASVSFRVQWPPALTPQTGEISVTSVTDDKGRSLYEAPPKMAAKYSMAPTYTGNGLTGYAQLTYPEADARKIASIKGSATIKFMLEEKTLSFDPVETAEPVKKEYKGMTVELTSYKFDGGTVTVSLKFTGKIDGADTGPMMGSYHSFPIRLRTEDGNSGYGPGRTSRSSGLDVSTWELTFPRVGSKVKAVEVVTETIYHSDTFDFELKDIPLPK